MIKEAIEKILALAPPTKFEVDGRHYSDKPLHDIDISTPLPQAVTIQTLSGMLDLINAKVEGIEEEGTNVTQADCILHVVSHAEVNLLARTSDEWGRRTTYVRAELEQKMGFPFGSWLDHERFLIGVMANFTEQGDRDYLVKLASGLTNERVVTSVDDGVSQQVGLKSGASLKTQETVRNRVKLAPFRTFREVEQPVSEFLFRVAQKGEEVPALALYEADGGAWKNTAMETIARFLRAALPGMTVVA